MRITDARVVVTCPGRNFVTLKIVTDEGLTGVGDATLNGRELAVAAYLDEHVLPVLGRIYGGDAGLGVVAAGALVAVMSTIAGLLLAAAASWGHDVYERHINPRATQRQAVRAGRATVALMAFASAGIALTMRPESFTAILPSIVAVMVTWAPSASSRWCSSSAPGASGPRRDASSRCRAPWWVIRCSAKTPPSMPVPPVISTVPSGFSVAGGISTILPVWRA